MIKPAKEMVTVIKKKKKKESLFPLSQGLLVHINKDKAEFTSLS